MRKLRSAKHSSQRGQGMTEYIIITALIAIGAIGAFVAFGDVVRGQVGSMAQELSGQDAAESEGIVDTAGGAAKTAGDAHLELSDYSSGNNAGGGGL